LSHGLVLMRYWWLAGQRVLILRCCWRVPRPWRRTLMGKKRVREVGVRGSSRSLRRSRVPRRPRARVPRLGSSVRRGPVRSASFSFVARSAHAPVPPTWWPRPSLAVPGFARVPPSGAGAESASRLRSGPGLGTRAPAGSMTLLRESSGGSANATRAPQAPTRALDPKHAPSPCRRRIDRCGRPGGRGRRDRSAFGGTPRRPARRSRRRSTADLPRRRRWGIRSRGPSRRASPTAPSSSLRRSAKRRGPGSADSSEPFAARKKIPSKLRTARGVGQGKTSSVEQIRAAKRGEPEEDVLSERQAGRVRRRRALHTWRFRSQTRGPSLVTPGRRDFLCRHASQASQAEGSSSLAPSIIIMMLMLMEREPTTTPRRLSGARPMHRKLPELERFRSP
jgi:hypothetical protein